MKVSLKLQDHHHHHHQQTHHKNHHHHLPPLLVRAKLPLTIFDLPFLSHFSTTTTHPSDLALSLSTNFLTGPSLKLSYATAAAASAASAATPPLSLTLKSGTGLFGSPNSSPLVISAHFSFNPSNPNNPNPTFSLFFKPQLGSFSLRKSTFSHTESSAAAAPTAVDAGCDSNNSFGFVPLERPPKDPSVEKIEKDSIFKGIQLTARTEIPLAKRVAFNFRWRADFAEDHMPILRINKIGIHRVYDVAKDDDDKKKKTSDSEVEALRGMCFWMKRELDAVTRVNREMKCELEEMREGNFVRNGGFREGNGNKAMGSVESNSGGFDKWRSKRNGGGKESGENGNGKREEKKNACLAVDVENELQRAIMAAASSSS